MIGLEAVLDWNMGSGIVAAVGTNKNDSEPEC